MQVKGTEWKFGLIFKSKEKKWKEKRKEEKKEKKEKVCSSARSIFD